MDPRKRWRTIAAASQERTPIAGEERCFTYFPEETQAVLLAERESVFHSQVCYSFLTKDPDGLCEILNPND